MDAHKCFYFLCLEEVKSPLEHFRQCFRNEFFAYAANFTNQYPVVKSRNFVNTNAQELMLFFALI